jgi:hypothetical protein
VLLYRRAILHERRADVAPSNISLTQYAKSAAGSPDRYAQLFLNVSPRIIVVIGVGGILSDAKRSLARASAMQTNTIW